MQGLRADQTTALGAARTLAADATADGVMVTGQITDLNRWFSEILVKLGLEGLAEV